MPRFIGQQISGARKIQDNASANAERVQITYSQAKLLPAEVVVCSLDTTDKGSRGTLAKRWYLWFASPEAILTCENSTENMRARAEAACRDLQIC